MPIKEQRWLRIIPVALIMYTISYVDRTNISLALNPDPTVSTMMRDLGMTDQMKGEAAGVFFFGYLLLQIPSGYLATRWGSRKLVSLFLVAWGFCAVGCGMAQTFRQFEVARFFLGVAESGVFPAVLVLLVNWFPRAERAQANGYWQLCQPLAVAGTAPLTGWLLGKYGWHTTLILEGALPFIWLPVWWFFIRDHPRQAHWISTEERDHLEATLAAEQASLAPPKPAPWHEYLRHPAVFVMILFYFLHNCAAYGCMTFFTDALKGQGFTSTEYGVLFALPYALTAVIMVLNSWHSDKTGERRGHIAVVFAISGASLILSVLLREHFWLSYVLLCFAIPAPFAGMVVFWTIPAETLPRNVFAVTAGLVNAVGNLGGFVGPDIVGWLKDEYHSTAVPFGLLGVVMLINAGVALLLPKASRPAKTS